ncbi:MAG TPA: tRNA pseudouridine(38-40) synthase TruA [Candidatus Acidoferrum sp.]|nr:tRNA pseudouridine(38-40) synthase TruA [Candidatus Acidoferrum sp.]
MHNIKLTIAYDGSDFSGWQAQPGQPTIQGALSDVASNLTQENCQIYGAGRTDAGVHALGQAAHFRSQSALSAAEFMRAFNALLPPAIRVTSAEEVGPDFHARWSALAKTYQYRILRARVLPPFESRYVLHDPFPLDIAAMARAARLFEGSHDFSSFAASTGTEEGDRDRSPVREISCSRLFARKGNYFDGKGFLTSIESTSASLDETANSQAAESDELLYVVRGKSFLRYMVRKIVGTLLDVGRGKIGLEDIPQLLEARDRSRSGPTTPPQGLYLVSVEYADPWKL